MRTKKKFIRGAELTKEEFFYYFVIYLLSNFQ